MTIAQSIAYVEHFCAPVLESLDKNLSKYGFASWQTFWEGEKKFDFKNVILANFQISAQNMLFKTIFFGTFQKH